MRKVSLIYVLAIVLLLAGCFKSITGIGSISGFIYLQNHTDHSEVEVKIKGTNKTYKTTSNGAYSFENLADGEYTLSFTKEGFQTIEKSVEVSNGSKSELEPLTLMQNANTTGNPVLALLQGHGKYFDFDTGEQTDNPSYGDMRLNAFSIYSGMHLMHIDEVIGQLFPETYPNDTLSFSQFSEVSLEDVTFPEDKVVFQMPGIGDVVVLKTDQNKIVKLILVEKIPYITEPEAPQFKFLYLYDTMVDTTIPVVTEVVLKTEDGNEYSQIPNGGELIYNIISPPVEIRLEFNEFVKEGDHYHLFDEVSCLRFYMGEGNIPYYNTAVAFVPEVTFAGEYIVNLLDDVDYYFQDLFGNKIIEKPFSQLKILYAPED